MKNFFAEMIFFERNFNRGLRLAEKFSSVKQNALKSFLALKKFLVRNIIMENFSEMIKWFILWARVPATRDF